MVLDGDAQDRSAEPLAAAELESVLQGLLMGDFQLRWEATGQLSAYGQAAIAPLLPLLEDEELDWEIRWFAARALGMLDDPAALKVLVELLAQTQEPELIAIAAEGVSQFQEKGIEALVQLLSNPTHRLTATHALARIHHEAVLMPLLEVAQDQDPMVREVALAALGNFRDPRVDACLLQAIQDPVAAVRQEAITLLGLRPHLLDSNNLVDQLLPGLWDLNLAVTQATAIALGRLGSEAAVVHLVGALMSPHTSEALQLVIVRALSWNEQEAALAGLLAFRQRASVAVKLEIIEALTRLEGRWLRQRSGAALCDWLTHLLPEHGAESQPIKQAIALALGTLQPPPAQSLLERLAQDANAQTCLHAQAALRQLAIAADSQSLADID